MALPPWRISGSSAPPQTDIVGAGGGAPPGAPWHHHAQLSNGASNVASLPPWKLSQHQEAPASFANFLAPSFACTGPISSTTQQEPWHEQPDALWNRQNHTSGNAQGNIPHWHHGLEQPAAGSSHVGGTGSAMWHAHPGQATDQRGTGDYATTKLSSVPPWHQRAVPVPAEHKGAPWQASNSTTAASLPLQEREALEVPPWQLRRPDQALSSMGNKGRLEEELDAERPPRRTGGSAPRAGRGGVPLGEKQRPVVPGKGGGRHGGVRDEQDSSSPWRPRSAGRGKNAQFVEDGYTPVAGRPARESDRSPRGGRGDQRRMQGDVDERFPFRGGRQPARRLSESSHYHGTSSPPREGPPRNHDPGLVRRRGKSRSRERRSERRRSGSRSPPAVRENSMGRRSTYRGRDGNRVSYHEIETDRASPGRSRRRPSPDPVDARECDVRVKEDRLWCRSEDQRTHSQPGREPFPPWRGDADQRAVQIPPGVHPASVHVPADAASLEERTGAPPQFFFDPTAGATFVIAGQPAIFAGLPPGSLQLGQAPFPFSAPLLWAGGMPAHPGDPQLSKAHDEHARAIGTRDGSAGRRCREEEDISSGQRRWGRGGRGRRGAAGRDSGGRGDRTASSRPYSNASSGRGSDNWLKRWEERASNSTSFRDAHDRRGSGSWGTSSVGRGPSTADSERRRDDGAVWRSGAEGSRPGRERGGGEDERVPRHSYDEFDRVYPSHLGENNHRDKGGRGKHSGPGRGRGRGPGEGRTGASRGGWSDEERDERVDGAQGQPEGGARRGPGSTRESGPHHGVQPAVPVHFSNKYPALRPAAIETLIQWYNRFTCPLNSAPNAGAAGQETPRSEAAQSGPGASSSAATTCTAVSESAAASPISSATDRNQNRDTAAPENKTTSTEAFSDLSSSSVQQAASFPLSDVEGARDGGAVPVLEQKSTAVLAGCLHPGPNESRDSVRPSEEAATQGILTGERSATDGVAPKTEGPVSEDSNTTAAGTGLTGETPPPQTDSTAGQEDAVVKEDMKCGGEGTGSLTALPGGTDNSQKEVERDPGHMAQDHSTRESDSDGPKSEPRQEVISSGTEGLTAGENDKSAEAVTQGTSGAEQGGKSGTQEEEMKKRNEVATAELKCEGKTNKDFRHEASPVETEATKLNGDATSSAAKDGGDAEKTWPHPKAALVLTSLPNLRVYALHRMITAHYKMHDATPLMLLLAVCPSTGRCTGYGIVLVQSLASLEKVLRAPLFVWRAAGGDGREGGRVVPDPPLSLRGHCCDACEQYLKRREKVTTSIPGSSVAASCPQSSLTPPSCRASGGSGRLSSDKCQVGLSKDPAGQFSTSGVTQSSDFERKEICTSIPGRNSEKSGSSQTSEKRDGGASRGPPGNRGNYDAASMERLARLTSGGDGGGGAGGPPRFEESSDRKREPLCDRAVMIHLLLAPTLQFQFNSRLQETTAPNTWSRTFFSSLWIQLFKSILTPPILSRPPVVSSAGAQQTYISSRERGDSQEKKAYEEGKNQSEESGWLSSDGDAVVPVDYKLLQKGKRYPWRPLESNRSIAELERKNSFSAATMSLLHTKVYTTAKRLYFNLPHAAVRGLLLKDAGLLRDTPFYVTDPIKAETPRPDKKRQRHQDSGTDGTCKKELEGKPDLVVADPKEKKRNSPSSDNKEAVVKEGQLSGSGSSLSTGQEEPSKRSPEGKTPVTNQRDSESLSDANKHSTAPVKSEETKNANGGKPLTEKTPSVDSTLSIPAGERGITSDTSGGAQTPKEEMRTEQVEHRGQQADENAEKERQEIKRLSGKKEDDDVTHKGRHEDSSISTESVKEKEENGLRGTKRPKEDDVYLSRLFESISRDKRPLTFSMRDDDGAFYNIEPLPKIMDDWYPWHVKYFSASSATHNSPTQVIADGLEALLRQVVEEQTYPVEYLAFEGVRFVNQWVLPPPVSPSTPSVLLHASASPDDSNRAIEGIDRAESCPRRHRVWGEGIEKTILSHVLLVQGLPNAPTQFTVQGLEKFLVRLWGSYLLSRASEKSCRPSSSSGGTADGCSSALPSTSSGGIETKAIDVLEQELWGWQLYDFPETHMIRGDGYLFLPSCMDATKALELLSTCALPHHGVASSDFLASSVSSSSPSAKSSSPARGRVGSSALESKSGLARPAPDLSPKTRKGSPLQSDGQKSGDSLYPVALPVPHRLSHPAAPYLFGVLPFEVSVYLKQRDLPFLASLVNTVLRHFLHRCAAGTKCCCGLGGLSEGSPGNASSRGSRSVVCCCCPVCDGMDAHMNDDDDRSKNELAVSTPKCEGPGTTPSERLASLLVSPCSSSCPSSPSRPTRTPPPPTSSCSCCCCVKEEDAFLSEEKKLKRRRPVPLGTAQVARGWLAGVPPLRIRPALPFPLPYAPAIKERSPKGEPTAPCKPEEDADTDFRPAPTCGAEHLVESLFFSPEAFFQLPFFHPFLRVCAPDQIVRDQHHPEEDLQSKTVEEEVQDAQGDDEEEGEMEEEEDNNELTAYIQRRENRWRRLGLEAMRELEEEQENVNLGSNKRYCRGTTSEQAAARQTAFHPLDVRTPRATDSHSEDGPVKKEEKVTFEAVKLESTTPDEKKEPSEMRLSVGVKEEEDEQREKAGLLGKIHQDPSKNSSVCTKGQQGSPNGGEELPAETGLTRKKKLLLRLEARPTLEDAHRLRVTPEGLQALEREGKFRFLPLSVLFFTPRYRSSFVQGYFPCRPQEDQGQFSPRSPDIQCTARDGASPPLKRGVRDEASRDTTEQHDQAESSERTVDHSSASVGPSKEGRQQEKQTQIQKSRGGDEIGGPTSAMKQSDLPGFASQVPSKDDKGRPQEDGGDSLLTPTEKNEATSFAEQLSDDKPQEGPKDEQGGLPLQSPPAAAGAVPPITLTEMCTPVSNVPESTGASLEFLGPRGLETNNSSNEDSAVLPVIGEPRGSQPAPPVLSSSTAQIPTDASQSQDPAGMEIEDKCALSGDVTQGGKDIEKRLAQVLPQDGDNERTQAEVSTDKFAEEGNNGESGSNAEVPEELTEKTGNPQEASCIERPHEANVAAAEIHSTGLCSSNAATQETIIQNTNTAPTDIPASVSLEENRVSLDQKHVPEREGFVSSVVAHEDLPDEHDPSECCTTKQPPLQAEQDSTATEPQPGSPASGH
ncbi:hypothetical protein CSUI_005557 [Cystoisospora suis]|uniref:Uncharacterized protein n=1 Tax=Cystoisospora suis TaxID=483139 RepID=A0A2C6KXH9_9APIC|nr:hypothetical protein CSUI_005557 [Cystoisospora suis]